MNCKTNLFPDVTLLFTVEEDLNSAASDMNYYLEFISQWACDLKMFFKTDLKNKLLTRLLDA